jgi:hypothetical protein
VTVGHRQITRRWPTVLAAVRVLVVCHGDKGLAHSTVSETVFPAYDPHRSRLYRSEKSHPKVTVL